MEIQIECYDCSLTDKSVTLKLGDYEQHNKDWHDSFLEACEKCPLRFSYPDDLDAHMADAHINVKQLCLECHRNNVELLLDEDEFHLHYLHEHPYHKVECSHCLNKFTSQTTCDQHAKLWHCNVNVLPEEIECPVCHKQFPPKDVDKHSTCHRGYDHKCPVCHVVYRSSGELGVHVSGHKSKKK